MKKLLLILTAVAGALCWSVPALAYRFEFVAMRDGVRVADSEVCFFSATTAGDPFGHFLASDDVRCLPADRVIDVPTGRWNYFVRSGREWTSARPALLKGTTEQRESGYASLNLELSPAGILDFAEVRKTLGADESLVVFIPTPFGVQSNARPVTRGADDVAVPAGMPLIPMVVRNARPVRVGDAVTVAAGERKAVAFPPQVAGTADVLVWLKCDTELAHDLDREALGAPSIALVTAHGERAPLVLPTNGIAANLEFQVFRGVPAGPARVVARGDSWESAELTLDVPSTGLAVVEEPLPLVPAGTVTVSWRVEGDRVQAPPVRQTCDAAETTAPAPPVTAMKRTLRILRCPLTAAGADCRVAFQRELAADDAAGTSRVGSLTAGQYVAELSFPPFATVREEVYAAPGRRVNVDLVAAPATVYGVVTRGGKPVRATVSIGKESFVTDTAGAFAAAIVRTTGTHPIHVTPCDTNEPFTYTPAAPLEANAFVAIDIPTATLAVRVSGRGGGAIDEAVVTLTVPSPASTGAADSIATLRRDAARGLYVQEHFAARESRLCAAALGYTKKCVDLRKDFDPTDEVALALEEKHGVSGRVVTAQPVLDGMLYVVGPGGEIVARSMIARDGAVELPSLPAPGSTCILAAANQPLSMLDVQPPATGELLLRPPAARSRHFAVLVAPEGGIKRGRLAITVGTVRVPTEVFETYQQERGLLPFLDGEHPLFVADVAETGTIGAQLLPLQPADLGTPLPIGLLPAESDLLLLH